MKELLHKDGTPMRKYSSPLINELNEETMSNKLDGLSELVTRVDAKILDINTKLDELIKALHDYDGNDEYGESSFEAFMDNEEATNKRMDIIGQNGNEGSHYNENEFDDYGKRVVVDKDKSNNSDKHTGGKKKYNNKYHRKPGTPVTPKK
jgi:hypothetical protein